MNGLEFPSERAIPDSHSALRREMIEKYVAALVKPKRRGFPFLISRFAMTMIGVPLVLASGAAMAYMALKPASVPIAQETRCYSIASLSGGDNFFGTTVGQASPEMGQTRPQAAIEICSALWRQGLLTLGSKGISEPVAGQSADHPVPRLVACTLENGVAAVIPGDERTCASLGLPRLKE